MLAMLLILPLNASLRTRLESIQSVHDYSEDEFSLRTALEDVGHRV